MKQSNTLLPGILMSLCLLLAGSLLPVADSYADWSANQYSNDYKKSNERRNGNDYKASQSGLDDAVARIQEQTGGRVLRARQKGSVYKIKVLMPSGVVKTFRVPAR